MKSSSIILTLLVSPTLGFKFMANFKVAPPTDAAKIEVMKQ